MLARDAWRWAMLAALDEAISATKFAVIESFWFLIHISMVATGGLFIHISPIRTIIQTVRRVSPGAKIVLGGAIASADPQFILDELKPDILVIGEAERTMDILLAALQRGQDLRQVTGIAFQHHETFVQTPPTPLIEDLDEIPFPDYEGFEFGYYLDHFVRNTQQFCSVRGNEYKSRPANVVSSRDCVSKCTFCFRITGGHYRMRSLSNFMAEIRYLIDRYQINEIVMLDEMFITGRDRLVEWCRALKQIGLPWQCQARVTTVEGEILALIKDSGCHQISFGLESGSTAVLKSMRKGITPELIDRAIRGAQASRLTIQGNFIFGDPAETLDTMEETFAFMRKHEGLAIGVGLITPYPGTTLYHHLVSEGKLTDRRTFHEKPGHKLYNMTRFSAIDFQYMIRKVKTEMFLRSRRCCGKILKLTKEKGRIYLFDVRCHICGGHNDHCRLDLDRGNLFVCRHCYQRVLIDTADLRLLDFSAIIYNLYYRYIMRVFVINPCIFRLVYPVRLLAARVKKILFSLKMLSKKTAEGYAG